MTAGLQTKTPKYLHEADLPRLARDYAQLWLRPGTVVALHGDLGAGKTAFVRALVREILGAEVPVPSPTFTIVQPYETPSLTIYHYDLYRLTNPSELAELGWQEAVANGLVLVEWPERAGNLLPPHWRVEITDGDAPDSRALEITPPLERKSAKINTAMVLAAGLGKRLRPLTEQTPKPLLKFGGITMLDRVLDQLAAAGIPRAVVNVHYLGEQIIQHVAARPLPQIFISDEINEPGGLESGGGIRRALPLLAADAFFTLNADAVWRDLPGHVPALKRMMQCWQPDKMDTLLLLVPRAQALGFDGPGDYFMEDDGTITWRGTHSTAPYVCAGVAIVKAKFFAEYPDAVFSQKRIWDEQEVAGRLYGLVHEGPWFHCSTPADYAAVNAALAAE